MNTRNSALPKGKIALPFKRGEHNYGLYGILFMEFSDGDIEIFFVWFIKFNKYIVVDYFISNINYKIIKILIFLNLFMLRI